MEEWRIKRTDTEQWMHHRQLPPELRHSVRRFDQYKWVATRGVDEEAILHDLPFDLRREIKRHLCLNLVRRVSSLILYHFFIYKILMGVCIYFSGFWPLKNLCIGFTAELNFCFALN